MLSLMYETSIELSFLEQGNPLNATSLLNKKYIPACPAAFFVVRQEKLIV